MGRGGRGEARAGRYLPAHSSWSGSGGQRRGCTRPPSLFLLLLFLLRAPRGPHKAAPRPLWHWPDGDLLSQTAPRPARPATRAADRAPERQCHSVCGWEPAPCLPGLSPALIHAGIQPSWPEDLGQGNSQLGTRRGLPGSSGERGPRSRAPGPTDGQDRQVAPGDCTLGCALRPRTPPASPCWSSKAVAHSASWPEPQDTATHPCSLSTGGSWWA